MMMSPLRATAFLLALAAAAACKPTPHPGVKFDGVLREVGDGRINAHMIPPFTCSHASFIERGGDEDSKVMAWFSGTKEGQSDVAIVVSCLQQTADGLGQWTKATVVSQRKGYSNQKGRGSGKKGMKKGEKT